MFSSEIPDRQTNPTPTREEVLSSSGKPAILQGDVVAPRHDDMTTANHTTWSRPGPPIHGHGNQTSGSHGDEEEECNAVPGVVPALIILSVLAVPIIFLLLTSIFLRARAYRRDKQNKFSRYHGNKNSLGVGHSRGWLSYMNCCDWRKYRFNRVTLQDYYSDSESDGV